jgi:transposase-like protein
MDTSTVDTRADTLGRRVVPRHFRSLEEKLRIVADARSSGGSVAAIARKYGVNANLIFAWMRLDEQGLLQARTRRSRQKLLAVTVAAAVTSEAVNASELPPRCLTSEHLEIALTDGICVRVFGAVPSEQIDRVLRLLRR